ncbi:MAG: hypothetical protein Q7T70_13635 [Polaromonas sp.]|nr:hypothetical protein [Polaromonas sp.]
MTIFSRTFLAASLLALAACSSGPKPADWELEAKTAVDRAVAAYMEGNARVEAVEFARALREVSSTGRTELVARVELTRCATRAASLVLESCSGFERLRSDAPPAERAYADYLAGRLQPQDAALLPAAQRAAAAGDAAALKGTADPLSQLVAAAVMFQAGRASPAVIQQAVDTASAQGWRRPLLAWLGVQAQLAEKAGDAEAAARLRRRMVLVEPPAPTSTPAPVPAGARP